MNYILYSTSACHLCEQAEAFISALPTPINYIAVDIIDDEKLLTKYGTMIPVLKCLLTDCEIHWPFSSKQLLSFIQTCAG